MKNESTELAQNPPFCKTDVGRRFSFRVKRQEKEFNRYIEKLCITTEGEKFVLYEILWRDWNRYLILISIDIIKFSDNVITV